MREVLLNMLEIYQPKGIDWMGYRMTPNNPYTFHHIVERRDGGKMEISNGAILTKYAHNYLNYLDANCPDAYEEYQKIFRFINSLNGPIPDELYDDIYEEIYYLAYEIEKLGLYEFRDKPRDFNKEKKEKRALMWEKKRHHKNKTKKRTMKRRM